MPSLHVTTASREATIAAPAEVTLLAALHAAGHRLRTACGGIGECGLCRIHVKAGPVSAPTPAEHCQLSPAELAQGLRLACQVRPIGDAQIALVTTAPPPCWTNLPDEDDARPAATGPTLSARRHPPLAVAVDLGTTQIRLSLWDLTTGTRLAACAGPNPQTALGADVLTRLTYATDDRQTAHELAWLARGAIGDGLTELATRSSIHLSDIRQVVIVGNTAMLCLLANRLQDRLLLPENWTRVIDCAPGGTTDWSAIWGLAPAARVDLVPPAGGFVGSDFLAAASTMRLTTGAAPALLVDFGANSEIGLWDGQTLWATATPGGPAFEGSGMSCGMAAKPGAIYRVERTPTPGHLRLTVIGGGAPAGICGSGLVDAIACLLAEGTLNPAGRLARSAGPDGIPLTGDRHRLTLRQHDIDAFQRAKSATATGIACLLERARIAPGDLQRVCVCGSFGRYLNVPHAQAVGLLPEVPVERVELEANAALHGGESLLLTPAATTALTALRAATTVINLAEDPAFEAHFVGQLSFRPMPAGLTEAV